MRLIDCAENAIYVVAENVVIKKNISLDTSISVYQHKIDNDSHIVSIASSSTHLFASFSDKTVCCWDKETTSLVSSAVMRKQSTAIQYGAFTQSDLQSGPTAQQDKRVYEVLLVSDKAGEVFAVDVPNMKKQALLAGHTASVITDLSLMQGPAGSARTSIVATADRDEKVRVSHFPDMENIQSFCLGHKHVVSSVQLLQHMGRSVAVSAGWDHQLILWDAMTGALLHSVSFQQNAGTETDGASSASAAAAGADAAPEQLSAVNGEEGEGEGDNDNDNDNDNDDPENKMYDEQNAGSYPWQIIVHPTQNVIAVLFKESATVQLFKLVNNQLEAFSATLTLPAHAVHATFVVDEVSGKNDLMALMPREHGVAAFRCDAASLSTVEVTAEYSALNGALLAYLTEKGIFAYITLGL
jgi:WD40 repeat protein